jgi:hypothetical protein
MASRNWWFKFDFKAWRSDPQLGMCSMTAQGVWINAICAMMESDSAELSGTIPELCRVIGCFPDELEPAIEELERTGAADVTRRNGCVTLVSRRLKKELTSKVSNTLRQQNFRRNARVTPMSHDRVRVRDRVRDREEQEATLSMGPASDLAETPKRGSRLSENFAITEDMRAWAQEKGVRVDLLRETEKFCNYYRAKGGQKGVRLDWAATWRNWILKAEEYNNGRQEQTTTRKGNADRLREYEDYFTNDLPS